jgi:hypothetical protein
MRPVYSIVHAFENMQQNLRRRLGRVDAGDPLRAIITENGFGFRFVESQAALDHFFIRIVEAIVF